MFPCFHCLKFLQQKTVNDNIYIFSNNSTHKFVFVIFKKCFKEITNQISKLKLLRLC